MKPLNLTEANHSVGGNASSAMFVMCGLHESTSRKGIAESQRAMISVWDASSMSAKIICQQTQLFCIQGCELRCQLTTHTHKYAPYPIGEKAFFSAAELYATSRGHRIISNRFDCAKSSR